MWIRFISAILLSILHHQKLSIWFCWIPSYCNFQRVNFVQLTAVLRLRGYGSRRLWAWLWRSLLNNVFLRHFCNLDSRHFKLIFLNDCYHYDFKFLSDLEKCFCLFSKFHRSLWTHKIELILHPQLSTTRKFVLKTKMVIIAIVGRCANKRSPIWVCGSNSGDFGNW